MNQGDTRLCEQVSFCSRNSLSRQEPLSATASNYQAFILIEYPAPFPGRLSDTKIDAAWMEDINRLAKERQAKVILIRNSRTTAEHLKVIFVDARRRTWCSHTFTGHAYKFFSLKLFIEAVDTLWHRELFFLVCTNGKKDKCCAKFGLPVFQALEKLGQFPVYEASHFGGDRFAGNAILMPHGIYYGRLSPDQSKQLTTATERGQILPEHYRGISSLNFARQTAECWLRKHLNNSDIHFPVTFLGQQVDDDLTTMRLAAAGRQFQVKLKKKISAEPYFLTCKSSTPEPVVRYEIVSAEEL